ncbi:MAG: Na/Pi cotransporter family protein [Spirochaetales bacterium]|nr:Na/Pi cotransporter family protein [Candidatus Physcosoma equi]
MDIADILSLLGGVALFLFGMTLMGEGLKQVAGNKLEVILYKLSGTPIKGILLGTGVTAVIQSSSATSVMVVGFVNSGMMKVKQAICIIMGAIVGTSITGWIISLSDISGGGSGLLSLLSTESLSAIVAIIGIYLRMFSKKRSHHYVGDILMGFAVLMFGMKSMSSAVSGLRSSPIFIEALTKFSNPILGILIGALFTTVIQSASAAVGILQALSSTGAITFGNAFPILMGIGVGAAVPVLLSALGSTRDGRRAALSYLLIDVIGAVFITVLFYVINAFVHFGFLTMPLRSVNIALINTLYRVIIIILMLPFISLLEKLSQLLVKEKAVQEDKELDQIKKLEERFLNYPALAVENVRLAMNAMAELTEKNICDAITLIRSGYTEKGFEEVARIENIIDKYEDSIGTYLVKLNGREMSGNLNRSSSIYLHTITDFERISDHAMNIAEKSKEMVEKNITLTHSAEKELHVLMDAIEAIVHLLIASFINNDMDAAYRVEPLEECIDDICEKMKLNHVDRLTNGECSLLNGYIFNDLLGDFERVSDHCSNTAATMIEMPEGIFGLHEYTNEIKNYHTHNFDKNYEEYKALFHV